MRVGHRDLRSLRSLKTALECYSGRRLPDPYGHKALCKHHVFDTCARGTSFLFDGLVAAYSPPNGTEW